MWSQLEPVRASFDQLEMEPGSVYDDGRQMWLHRSCHWVEDWMPNISRGKGEWPLGLSECGCHLQLDSANKTGVVGGVIQLTGKGDYHPANRDFMRQ